VVELAVFGLQLDSMILKVFSNLNDSMVLEFPGSSKGRGSWSVACACGSILGICFWFWKASSQAKSFQ